ncbi:MAG TPA: hypothetical protein VFV01_41325 [Spirillospora sp.]|nr:hypothetical protein [Spirillospora sp.]
MRKPFGRPLLGAVVVGAGIGLFAAPAGHAAQPLAGPSGFRVVDLGTLHPGGDSSAAAINGHGDIAGASDGHAVLWRRGHMIDLGVPKGAASSAATALNDRGDVVGYLRIQVSGGEDPVFTLHAFLWRGGRMHDLGTLPGGDYSVATAVNSAGDIVGRAGASAGVYNTHAVMWHQRRIVDLQPGGLISQAEDITADGWIVGMRGTPAEPGNDNQVVAWFRGGSTPSLFRGVAFAANDRHQIAGSDDAIGAAVVWSRGVTTRLALPAGDVSGQAEDINDRGVVVGWADSGPVVWHDAVPTVLPGLVPPESGGAAAGGINDRGAIVGSASTADFHGHAVMWTRLARRA